jgi:UDP-N-acetyl-D-mannosaminuronic acid dehydrogenase
MISTHPHFQLHSLADVVKKADIILLLVGHKPFKKLKAAQLSGKIVIDRHGFIT